MPHKKSILRVVIPGWRRRNINPLPSTLDIYLKWLEELTKKWAAAIAHCFVLHGNATDTVNGQGTAMIIFTVVCFQKRYIIRYDRAGGIQFPIPAHQLNF